MKKTAVIFAAIVAAILAFTGIGQGTAQAAPMTALGGGSGILIPKGGNNAAACTVTAVGQSSQGLIALTAGHCGVAGQTVLSEKYPNRGSIGTITVSDKKLDVAIIKLDAAKVRPVSTVGGVTIKRISTKPIAFPTIICKQGRTTGNTCGITYFSEGGAHFSQMCVIEGDSGSPVVVGTTLVGMVNAYYFVSCLGPETGTNMGPIMSLLNARGYHNFKVA